MNKYISRKFILTIVIMILSVVVPVIFKNLEISNEITAASLVIIGGIGVAYGIVNVKAKEG